MLQHNRIVLATEQIHFARYRFCNIDRKAKVLSTKARNKTQKINALYQHTKHKKAA